MSETKLGPKNGLPLISSLGRFPNAQIALESLWCKKVHDYLSFSANDGVCRAMWKEITNDIVPMDEKVELVVSLTKDTYISPTWGIN